MRIKKLVNILICAIIMIFAMNSVALASTFNPTDFTSVEIESNILPPEIQKSIGHVESVSRGVFFAAADLGIANNDGDIDVTAHAYMSVPVDEIYMTIYLDRYVVDEDGDDDWVYVDMFEFEFYAEDYPDGELTSESVEFTLTGYPKGEYYRLRGAYAAVKDGVIEGFGPSTDGILIE